MHKIFFYIFLIVSFLSCKSEAEKKIEICNDALTLAIEKNLKYRSFTSNRRMSFSDLTTKVFLIPLNKEIIKASIELKASQENMSENNKALLYEKNNERFLKSDRTAFVFIIINSKIKSNEYVYIKNLPETVFIKCEGDSVLPVVDFTPSLAASLSPGWNSGYVYFEGQIPSTANSFSVVMNNILISADEDVTGRWAATFDQTEVGFLSLLQQGLKAEKIREKYIITPYEESGLTKDDVINVISFLYQTISIFK